MTWSHVTDTERRRTAVRPKAMPPAYRRRVSRAKVMRREAEKLLRQLRQQRPDLFQEQGACAGCPRRKSPPAGYTPPRYDDVYAAGVAWLNGC